MDLFSNNDESTLASGISSGATSCTVASGEGARFAAKRFNAWIYDAAYSNPRDDPDFEIVRVTDRSGDELTIVRGQEGTAAAAHSTGGHTYRIVAGLTAKSLNVDFNQYQNARAYDLLGDGSTDDQAALNALVNTTLQVTGAGGDVYFPEGDYLISSNITLPKNVRLHFDPKARLKPANSVVITDLTDHRHWDKRQKFTNALSGQGTVMVEDSVIFPQWWGADAGARQVELTIVAGTITGNGDVSVVVTAAGMSGSPKTLNVAVLNGDTPTVVAGKIRAALAADSVITGFFLVDWNRTTTIMLTRIIPAANDATMNIALGTGTATGLTAAPTSQNIVAGVAAGDSFAAIQAAFDAHRYGHVMLVDGDFVSSATVVLRDALGRVWRGHCLGMNSSITFTNAGSSSDTDVNMQRGFASYPTLNAAGGDSTGLGDSIFDGLKIVGPTHGAGFYAANCSGMSFKNGQSWSNRYGVLLESSIGVKIHNNFFLNNKNAGLCLGFLNDTARVYYGASPAESYWNDLTDINGNKFIGTGGGNRLAGILDHGSNSQGIRTISNGIFVTDGGVASGMVYGYLGRKCNPVIKQNFFEQVPRPIRLLTSNASLGSETNIVDVSGAEPSGTYPRSAIGDGTSFFCEITNNYFTGAIDDMNLQGVSSGTGYIGQNMSSGLNGIQQVETATVAGTITGDGNVAVVVTAVGMTNSGATRNVAVLNGDSAATVAGKIRTALAADSEVNAFFVVSGSGSSVVLTARVGAANDATMNISTANGTSTGLTSSPTSANTTAGAKGYHLVLTESVGLIIDSGDTAVSGGLLPVSIATPSTYKPLAAVYATALTRSSNFSIGSAVDTAVEFNSEIRDDGDLHSLVSNTERITIALSGWYDISAVLEIESNATGIRQVSIVKNSATRLMVDMRVAMSGFTSRITLGGSFYLAAGDYIRLFVYQNSGSTLNLLNTGVATQALVFTALRRT